MGVISNIMDNSIENKMMKSFENVINSTIEEKINILAVAVNASETHEHLEGTFKAWRDNCLEKIIEHIHSIFLGADVRSNQCFVMAMDNPSMVLEDFNLEDDVFSVGMVYALACFSMTRRIPNTKKCVQLNRFFAHKIDKEICSVMPKCNLE